MNKAIRKLDNTILNWREWLNDLGIEVDWDKLDEEFVELISNDVDKIKETLNQAGTDSLFFKGLK